MGVHQARASILPLRTHSSQQTKAVPAQLESSKRKPGIKQGAKPHTVSEPFARFLFYVLARLEA